jgi:hypothetical protein
VTEADWFREQLAKYPRIAIAGGPRTGKTTLASACVDRRVCHTDSFMDYAWEDVPPLVISELYNVPRFVVEGVQVPRCLRKGMKVDAVIWMDQPRVPLTDGQRTMMKAVRTVFLQWCATNESVPVLQSCIPMDIQSA